VNFSSDTAGSRSAGDELSVNSLYTAEKLFVLRPNVNPRPDVVTNADPTLLDERRIDRKMNKLEECLCNIVTMEIPSLEIE
jgi:hypothetical protein